MLSVIRPFALSSVLFALASSAPEPVATSNLAFFNQVGPCEFALCPQATFTVCHSGSGTSVKIVKGNGIKLVGLGLESMEHVTYMGWDLSPCGSLCWDDVDECEDICGICP